MMAAAEGENLTGLWFEGQKYFPHESTKWIPESDHYVFRALREYLRLYFMGIEKHIEFQLAPVGTEFQKKVWDILMRIPFGSVTTYKTIASEFGNASHYSQAVGRAVGHNPISILIPCHRVIGSNGSLTGYAGGIDKKEALLNIERSVNHHQSQAATMG
jgi:methylated-DNA-[protein]-cysteine S-methyltransferase